ncbi:MAG: hypothetical protein BMS9Abin02_0673 [Anaerolineae bacterium]|nr:MAG: hypothetical protein BMS9Abin02_0673 [Anaerolineae bacterium]
MDFTAYREEYFVDPAPEQGFGFAGIYGVTLYFEEYEEAVNYYRQVLGPPAYSEGEYTRGWQLGDTWLTLLKGKSGSPINVEVTIVMESAGEAERLQMAFLKAGGVGPEPNDQLMYYPVRSCPVTDPFGSQILIYSHLNG